VAASGKVEEEREGLTSCVRKVFQVSAQGASPYKQGNRESPPILNTAPGLPMASALLAIASSSPLFEPRTTQPRFPQDLRRFVAKHPCAVVDDIRDVPYLLPRDEIVEKPLAGPG